MSGGQMQDLEKAVRNLQAIEDIKKVQAKYSYLVDSSKLDALLDLFTDDASANFVGIADMKDKEAMRKFLGDVVLANALMLRHLNSNPIIDVDGDTAVGVWYVFGPGTMKSPNGPVATWFQGKYTNQYVNVNGQWKFKRVMFEPSFSASYAEGWAKAQGANTGSR